MPTAHAPEPVSAHGSPGLRHGKPRTFKHKKFGREIVLTARRKAMDGLSPHEIWLDVADTGVSVDLIRRWCYQGRGYPDAMPPGFQKFCRRRTAARWTRTSRLAQLSTTAVKTARSMAMTGACLLDIQDHLNHQPGITRPITGIGKHSWSESDLFHLLFGRLLASDQAIPAGYRDWCAAEGLAIKAAALGVEKAIKRHEVPDPTALELVVGRPTPGCAEGTASLQGEWQFEGLCIEDPDEVRRAFRVFSEVIAQDDPLAWAGLIVHAATEDARHRKAAGLPKRHVRRYQYVDEIVRAAGCSAAEARRALRIVSDRIGLSQSRPRSSCSLRRPSEARSI